MVNQKYPEGGTVFNFPRLSWVPEFNDPGQVFRTAGKRFGIRCKNHSLDCFNTADPRNWRFLAMALSLPSHNPVKCRATLLQPVTLLEIKQNTGAV
jgi:hypothetical protein